MLSAHIDRFTAKIESDYRKKARNILMKEAIDEKRCGLCLNCGAKARLQLLPETELKAFSLFCPKRRHESIINTKHFIIETKQPDAKMQY